MKIVICGSNSFRNEKIGIRDKLNSLGHKAIIDIWTEKLAKGEAEELAKKIEKEHSEVKKEYDLIRLYYNMIKDSDAILVVNLDKNNIKNYIGANTFLEIGYAHYLNKKIFLFNPLPEQEYILDELKTADPIIINQDLSKIPINQPKKFMDKIILATKSPYRKQAFNFLGFDFTTEASNIDEYNEGRPNNPEELVKYLARLKAEAVAKNHSDGIIIGFDSVAYFDNQILEKPKSKQEVFDRLKSLSGKYHEFYTGIYMINLDNNKRLTEVVKTEVLMRDLSEKEINKYLDKDSNYQTYALGYDPLCNYSSTFVKKIKGSYNNLTRGIPLETIVEMLKDIGYSF